MLLSGSNLMRFTCFWTPKKLLQRKILLEFSAAAEKNLYTALEFGTAAEKKLCTALDQSTARRNVIFLIYNRAKF